VFADEGAALKYSDCPEVQLDVRIAAPPESIWPLVADIALPSRFSTELQDTRWCEGFSEPAEGARFFGRNEHPIAGKWQTTCTLISYDPPREFSWAVEDVDNPAATWRFELEPDGDGTRLRQWVRMGPGPSLLNGIIDSMPDREEEIVAFRLGEFRTGMLANLEGIKALAER
jgi:uncharacterized protein YndB with AHSA1/START domain